MLLTLWHYLKGYVIIEINGFSIERFLNLAVHKGINIENIKETKNGVVCKVLVSDFKELKSCCKKTKCKIKVKQKLGLPFVIFKNKKRKAFGIGVLFFVFSLWFLSSFIWSIEVVGNSRIDNNSILKFCEENGFYIGAFKNKIQIKDLEKTLKNNFKDLSWVTIQLDGTKAKIKLAENLPQIEFKKALSPSNIVAKEDAIISEISTKNGTPLVKEKDVVKKGDVLVSGTLLIKEGEEVKGTKLVPADAEIKAKSWHTIKVTVPFKHTVKEYTKKSKTRFEFLAFNKTFSLNIFKNAIPYENYDKVTSRTQLKLKENFPLPFMLITHKFKEYKNTENLYTLDEAKEEANKLITEKIIQGFDFSTDILEKNVYFDELDDKIIATANLTIIQDIGVNQEISEITEERNASNGTEEDTNSQ